MCLAAITLNWISAATNNLAAPSISSVFCDIESRTVGCALFTLPTIFAAKASLFYFSLAIFLSAPTVLAAYDAFARARVPQRQLHLWVGLQATLSLYALGTLHPCLSDPQVSELPFHRNSLSLSRSDDLLGLGRRRLSCFSAVILLSFRLWHLPHFNPVNIPKNSPNSVVSRNPVKKAIF